MSFRYFNFSLFVSVCLSRPSGHLSAEWMGAVPEAAGRPGGKGAIRRASNVSIQCIAPIIRWTGVLIPALYE
jgi:hypothetical protein